MIVSCRSRSSASSPARLPAARRLRWRLRAGRLAVLIAVATASCSSNTPPPSSGGSPGPNPSGQRLSWSQVAGSQAIVQNYDFILFVDGNRSPLSGTSCMGIAPAFDCLAPLPVFAPGRHVLEMSALDRTTGLESARSEQLIANTTATATTIFGTTRPPITSAAGEVPAASPDAASAVPDVACARLVSTCFAISTVSGDVGDVRRLAALPDSRLLALSSGGVAQVLPGGDRERLPIDARHAAADVADIAVDPDFLTNHYVYAALVASGDDGRATTSVVRFRELAGRFGEPATIAADLPAAQGPPAISAGPDRRLYLALPSADDRRGAGPYDGVVLRLTREGAAAGYERARSPILAVGSSRPASFAWVDSAHLLLASAASAASQLSVVPLQVSETFAPASVPVQGVQRVPLTGGITQVAPLPVTSADPGETRVVVLGTAPPALYVARMTTGAAPAVIGIDYVSLGGLAPVALAVDSAGDLLVSAHQFAGSPVQLLRLRVDPPQKSP
jgi:hypothetical protein